jgi:DNA-binding helix-hairpin-helix protein with protein kinase domain
MSTILAPGEVVQLHTSNNKVRVEVLLGHGGQGEVYMARLVGRKDDRPVALKWYMPQMATPEQLEALVRLIKGGPPDARRFLWPLNLAIKKGHGFGYLMPLREPRFHGMADLMKGEVTTTFRVRTQLGYELADGFLQLHAGGYCYRDISFGNVFFDPDSGEVAICDNDNVGFDRDSEAAVIGTLGFMAPEILRGEAPPSAETDRFSLAVLLFYIFMLNHPFHGRLELTEPVLEHLYRDPVFIFDPSDHSNEAVPGEHDGLLFFWRLYPEFFRQRFVEAFTSGLQQNQRVRETEWRLDMVRLRDAIVYCQDCGTENFWDEQRTGALTCWSCGKEVTPPPRLVIGDPARHPLVVMLNHDTRLHRYHVGAGRKLDFGKPVAEVARHPKRPDVWGLRNLTDAKWVATTSLGSIVEVVPGQSVKLDPDTGIQFGMVEGFIRY